MFIPLEPRSNIVHFQKERYPRIQLDEHFQIRVVLKKFIKVDEKRAHTNTKPLYQYPALTYLRHKCSAFYKTSNVETNRADLQSKIQERATASKFQHNAHSRRQKAELSVQKQTKWN